MSEPVWEQWDEAPDDPEEFDPDTCPECGLPDMICLGTIGYCPGCGYTEDC